MKKKIADFIIDVFLIGVIFTVTDTVMLNVFQSKSLLLEIGIYCVFYAVFFGLKQGVMSLWERFVSKNKSSKC